MLEQGPAAAARKVGEEGLEAALARRTRGSAEATIFATRGAGLAVSKGT